MSRRPHLVIHEHVFDALKSLASAGNERVSFRDLARETWRIHAAEVYSLSAINFALVDLVEEGIVDCVGDELYQLTK